MTLAVKDLLTTYFLKKGTALFGKREKHICAEQKVSSREPGAI